MWQTFTPDGRNLMLRRTETGWVATCLSKRIEAETPGEAIREAVGRDLNDGPADALEQWISELVAELDAPPPG